MNDSANRSGGPRKPLFSDELLGGQTEFGAGRGKPKKTEIVCLCNNISRDTIESAIREGADTLNKIFDQTTAGVGPCGGSCRRKLQPMLDTFLTTGKFPSKLPTVVRRDPRVKKDDNE